MQAMLLEKGGHFRVLVEQCLTVEQIVALARYVTLPLAMHMHLESHCQDVLTTGTAVLKVLHEIEEVMSDVSCDTGHILAYAAVVLSLCSMTDDDGWATASQIDLYRRGDQS